MPKDIHWQKVHDDIESFERRLRLAAYFYDKSIGKVPEGIDSKDHLTQVPDTKEWNQPKPKFYELEFLLMKARNDIINPKNIRVVNDNLKKYERLAIKQFGSFDITIRMQDKESRFVIFSFFF